MWTSSSLDWEEQSLAISFKWGTHGFESAQKDRPQFKSMPTPDGSKLRSFVDNKEILYYPEEQRLQSQVISSVYLLVCIAVVIGTNVYIFMEIRKTRIVEILSTGTNGANHSITSWGYMIYALLVPVFSVTQHTQTPPKSMQKVEYIPMNNFTHKHMRPLHFIAVAFWIHCICIE